MEKARYSGTEQARTHCGSLIKGTHLAHATCEQKANNCTTCSSDKVTCRLSTGLNDHGLLDVGLVLGGDHGLLDVGLVLEGEQL